MARRTSSRKVKQAAADVKTSGKRRSSSRRSKSNANKSKDVFSDDDDEAQQQERQMNERADVDQVFEYEEPTFEEQDSEVDEDEAFNSDDEEQYGLFFNKSTTVEEQEDDDDEDEEDVTQSGDLLSDLLGSGPASRLSTASDNENEEDQEKLNNLSKLVDGLVEKPKTTQKLQEIDSQFATAADSCGELTLGSLLGASTAKPGAEAAEEEEAETKTKTGLDLRRMRQQVRELEGDGTTLTLQANREPVHDARAARKLAYVEKTKDVDVFEPVVRRNRQKETLDLRGQAPKLEKLTPATLSSKFTPQTDMEKSVAALLQAGDLSDKKLAKDEEEELARKRVSTEEVAARQKELAKLRSLLFYEEQKQRRVKKIKSKLYHKIRNAQDKKAMAKQKEELRSLDPEMARKLDEELAEKRAEERLTLKHRNTSKWVKHQLRRGINADDATRSAIADQLRRGEELRRKMNAVDSDDEDMDDDDDDDDDDDEGDAASRLQKRLEKQASALVTEIDDDATEAGKKRGLQGMKFMQRAAEKQREKSRVEAEKLLREIRSGADDDRVLSEGEDYLSSGEEGSGGKSKKAKKVKKNVVVTAEDKDAVDRALAKGALQTSSVSMSGGVSARASGTIAVDLGEGGGSVALANGKKEQGKDLELGAKNSGKEAVATSASTEAPSNANKKATNDDDDMQPTVEGEENPWLSSTATKSKSRNSKKNKKKAQQQKTAAAQVNGVAAAIESLEQDTKETSKEESSVAALTGASSKTSKKRKLDQAKTSTKEEFEEAAPSNQKKSKKNANKQKGGKTAGQDELEDRKQAIKELSLKRKAKF
ncbi:U3 small nucleolar RNA-associated protein 14 A [Phytophthora boehmeriae]|uniref:U3 small nucleolar RNA-associated protein 14 A n=1 Tax=Phytophthora boehmeriae TaxID=109152 RepID=A0A8T1WMV3_9STRA|nr:U3 small nucleolar RNA-associated protein 14 A [Phytophthora boehmeriae]